MLLAAAVMCTSSLMLSSFTDSSYQKTNPANPASPLNPTNPAYSGTPATTSVNGKTGGGAWYDTNKVPTLADKELCGDRFELNVFDQNDEQALYDKYGYSRGDMHHVFNYKFDINTVETFSGTVSKVMRARYPDGDCYVLIIISTDSGDYLVNVGPVWYIDQNSWVINEGDTIQLRGSKVRMNGRFLILVSEIKKNGEVLKFRDFQGNQAWTNRQDMSNSAIPKGMNMQTQGWGMNSNSQNQQMYNQNLQNQQQLYNQNPSSQQQMYNMNPQGQPRVMVPSQGAY